MRTALADPAVIKRLQDLGVEPAYTTPAEFQKYLRGEIAKYAEYVRVTGIQLE